MFTKIQKNLGKHKSASIFYTKRKRQIVAKFLDEKLVKCGLKHADKSEIMQDTSKQYRRYFIAKKSGGKREICQASKTLIVMQKAILPVIKLPPVSKCSSAYEKGNSVLKNAIAHKKAKHILHLDIKDFFPSINKKMFIKTYKPYVCCNCKQNCDNCIEQMWAIASLEGGLPIGSRLSPFISNRVMFQIDKKLAKLDKSLTYTRYADDMIFSGKKRIDGNIIQKIYYIIKEEGFNLNEKKTFFMSYRKKVTGILVQDGKLSLGTSYKKRLKQDIYNFLTKGVGKISEIKGRFSWLYSVEPKYAQTIKQKYASIDNVNLFKIQGLL